MEGKLAIVGAGGHGRVVADCASAAGWRNIVFYDDAAALGSRIDGCPVEGNIEALHRHLSEISGVIVAIGNNSVRVRLHRVLLDAGAPLVTIVHPRAILSAGARVGTGTVLVAGSVTNTGAVIGEAVIVNTGATVDHDCKLGLGVHVSPGANLAGGAVVGDRSWIGIGAVVRENVEIGADVLVGAGAVIIAPVEDGMTVVGNPGRVTRRNS